MNLPTLTQEEKAYAEKRLKSIPVQEVSSAQLCPQPLVSVLVLTYRHEAYIRETLDSILRQKTDFPFEIIIAEDCSPDKTREIALEYQQGYPEKIRVLFSEQNVGMCDNLHRLYAAVRGKYLAHCEGDDYWCDEMKLQKQVECLEAHPEAILCHTDYHYLNMIRGSKWIYNRQIPLPESVGGEELTKSLILDRYQVKTPTVMICFKAFGEIRDYYLLHDRPAMDNFLLILLSLTGGKFRYLPCATAVYRQVPGSATARGNGKRRYEFMQKIYETQKENILLFNFPALLPELQKKLFPELWSLALRNNDWRKVVEYGDSLTAFGQLSRNERLLLHWKCYRLLKLIAFVDNVIGYLRSRKAYRRKKDCRFTPVMSGERK